MKIAGVRFREGYKIYDFEAAGLDVFVGDKVIVESDRGQGFAHVVRIRHTQEQTAADEAQQQTQVADETAKEAAAAGAEPIGQIKRIIRKATEEDIAKDAKNRELEAEAFKMCQEMISERELPMKLISAEYSFDASRATFFFFSETRVDFRELVKELAHKLKSRIEMRQIGVRDVARTIGGYGPCGRELCCASYLRNFEPVSIRMAKKQEMVLNPAKISGVCGRLLCCLSYEYEFYDDIKKDVAGLREAAVKEKTEEEERRITEERKAAEARRIAEEKKRQEERRQKESGFKAGGKPEKKEEKKAQPQADQSRERQQQPRQESQQPQQASGEKGGKSKKRRRFWRRRRKQQQGGPNPPSTDSGKS